MSETSSPFEDPWQNLTPEDPDTEEDSVSGFPASPGNAIDIHPEEPQKLEDGELLTDYKSNLYRYHIKFLKKRQKQRQLMLIYSICAMAFVLITGGLVMGFYMWSQWGNISNVVMTAWLVTVVAQVTGILYIIADFLFPKEDHAVEKMILKSLGNED